MNIDKAENEARRFLGACAELRNRRASDDRMREFEGVCGFMETAAVRRVSMDLTRALAGMRKAQP